MPQQSEVQQIEPAGDELVCRLAHSEGAHAARMAALARVASSRCSIACAQELTGLIGVALQGKHARHAGTW